MKPVTSGYQLVLAREAAEYGAGERLFREYAASLDFDLCFQGFEQELREINTQYSRPTGSLLLVQNFNEYVGCAGVRKFEDGVGELKRMYVQPSHRGRGLGSRILAAAIEQARQLSYQRIRLDTVESMREAIKLYTMAGFYPIEPYRPNPVASVLYFELKL